MFYYFSYINMNLEADSVKLQIKIYHWVLGFLALQFARESSLHQSFR